MHRSIVILAATGLVLAPSAQAGTMNRAGTGGERPTWRYVPVTYTYRADGISALVAESSPDLAFSCRSGPAGSPDGGGRIVTCSGAVRIPGDATRPLPVSIRLRAIGKGAAAGSVSRYVSGRQWRGACSGSPATTCALQVLAHPVEFGADAMIMP